AAPGAVLPRLAALAGRGARPAVGPVRLTRLLGEGGMGRVWAGEHRDTGDPVAVKVLHAALLSPETRALFEAEARAVARLDHPGVVRVLAASRLDAGEAAMLALEAGTPAIVMERVDAGALDPYGPAWRWEGARDLLLALLDALAHAHARGVLHLDVKPSNVLVARDGAARLVDFGLAGMVGVLEGHVLGTPAYMAPEQTLGRDLGPWTDLYAVGVTAWELVTGARPFADPDVGTLLALQRHAPLPAFRPRFAVPAGLEAWLRVLLDKEPGARFSRAADAAHALRCLGEPVGIGRAVVPPRDHPATFHVSGPAATTRVLVHAGEPRPATFTRATPPPAPFPAARSEPRPTPRPFLPESGEGLLGWRVPRLRGRDAERERLWACLAEVHATRVGRAVAIVGPPGSGRSRLAQWLAEEAHATGAAHVVHVRAADGDAAAEEVMARKADRPVVALLEDADGVAGLLGLVRALADAGVLVVLTATRPPPLDAETIPLGPLSPADLMGLLDELLPIDRALAIALVERAAGSPAAGVAMLADLVARDALAPGAEGFGLRPGEAIAFARRALSAWTRRADAVAPPGSPARAALEIAAVAGTKVAREEWAAACSDAGVFELDAAVAPLREAGLLVVGEDVDLADQALREAIVEAATASGRAPVWHGVWAARARDPGRLGRHLLFAGRPLEALGPLRAGAADAVNAVRLVACRELLELWDRAADAAGLAEDDPRRASPLVVRSFLAYHLGEDELAPLARALPLVAGRDAHEEARIRYSTGMALRHADRPAEAEVAFRDALALVDDPGSMMPGLCLAGLAAARFEQGADGSAEIERARARLAERWPALADRCDVVLGQGLQRVGRRAEARAALLRGEAVTRAQGWRLDEAEVLRDLARIAVAEGDVADAEARLTRACAILRAAGSDRQFEAEAELAELLLGAGRGEEARALAAAALARFGWRMEAGLRARLELAGAAGG
ncbi:MAG: protein kinase domain-containing protein, partial [Myxococcota bacterium]